MSTSWHHRTRDVSFRTRERQIENLEDIEGAHVVSVVVSKGGVPYLLRKVEVDIGENVRIVFPN